jgi:hypothetical protein
MAHPANGVSGNEVNENGTNGIQHVLDTLKNIDAGSFANDADRIQAVVAAYSLVSRLETPWEFLLRTCMGQVLTSLPPTI